MNETLAARARTLAPHHPEWPERLTELRRSPESLRIVGVLPDLRGSVAIVGTRRASAEALSLTEAWAAELAGDGHPIVSGGAEGIDGAAHRATLGARGRTVVVLAGGLEHPYPRAHVPLFFAATESGAVLTELEDERPALKRSFLERNRLIAALASVVVVVQAPLRSGALSTATHALELGRPLLVVPWSVGDPHGQGCLELLASRRATVCRGPDDIRAALGEPRVRAAPRKKSRTKSSSLSAVEQRLLANLTGQYAYAEELVRATGLGPAEVQLGLMSLLLAGEAERDLRGAYRRRYRET